MSKFWRNKKGIAIEMAITTMLVVFALSTIFLVIAELANKLNETTEQSVGARVDLDRVGEDFYQAQRTETAFDATAYDDYTLTVEDVAGGKRMTVQDETGRTLLTVEVQGTGGTAKIVQWSR